MGWVYDARSRQYIHSSGRVVPVEYAEVSRLEHKTTRSGTRDTDLTIILDVEDSRGYLPQEAIAATTNCTNCGAAKDAAVCSYCGTRHL